MSRNIFTRPKGPAARATEFHGIVTGAPQMLEFFEVLKRVSRTESSIVVRGETGTGKELVARAIHQLSPRARGPFRAVNCATFTPELLASELFGHVRGAFTGAVRDRQGLFAAADGGTIFLDEIAELPLELQARLLRVVQERTFMPVGSTDIVHVDVRIVSATHQALRERVEVHRFREDLMYRLRVVPIFLPRLVERDGDIELLLWHFIEDFNKKGGRVVQGVDSAAMKAILDYDWPGNIRELHNVVEYAFAVGLGTVLQLQDLTPEILGQRPIGGGERDSERVRIQKALREADGHKARAAEALGISRSTLWRKLRELQIS
jgi:transcriptional regulator with PAS, ATPase and Fis domain